MSSIFGKHLKMTLFGESHGEYIGGTLDGVPAGIKIDYSKIDFALIKRRPFGSGETARVEKDDYKIISGVLNGYTTGSPLTILIKNENIDSTPYEKNKNIARPSQVDYVSFVKYKGFNDYRGGGHFSGRLTAVIVCLGTIINASLENKGIYIGTHIKKCGNIIDCNFSSSKEEIIALKQKLFPTLLPIEEEINNEILKVAKENDSIGGILETCITGLPIGLGDPLFESVESRLSSALFSIGGVKGVEFGLGFDFANYKGSQVNDEFYYKDNKVRTKTNNNGGINGGITNGEDVIFSCVIRPTPSIGKTQNTIDFINKENTSINISGRHDPAFIRRVAIVIDSIASIVIADLLLIKYGEDYLM